MDSTDIAIVGAGVVGLALAAEITERFPRSSLVLFERHPGFGRETSSRNSEVIHAGIYYPPGSLKATLCVEGNRLLYEFCRKYDVPYRRPGKVIVAGSRQEAETLTNLYERGIGNGVAGLFLMSAAELSRLEPEIQADCALYAPSTGVVDTHILMQRLEAVALTGRAVIVYRHEVTGLECDSKHNTLRFSGPDGREETIECGWIVNSTGLSADRMAAAAGIAIDQAGYRIHLCKGEYFSLSPQYTGRIRHLMYPPPYADDRGLGIHLTTSLDGRLRLGPNALYVDTLDYSVEPGHALCFYDALKDYLPFMRLEDLQPDTAGIRPKLQAQGMPVRDFVICRETQRGRDRLINLIGIESPGLTACLSIARMVADMIARG